MLQGNVVFSFSKCEKFSFVFYYRGGTPTCERIKITWRRGSACDVIGASSRFGIEELELYVNVISSEIVALENLRKKRTKNQNTVRKSSEALRTSFTQL